MVSPSSFDGVFDRIGKEWMLITAKGNNGSGVETVNTMTASWGGMGVLWGRQVAFLFVRPERYTCPLIENATHLSLSFFGDGYRDALRLCGTKSGRDVNKFEAAGLTLAEENGVPVIEEAKYTLICRKLYVDTLRREGFCLPLLLENYQAGGLHRVFVVEIENILEKE
jgi:flavin reductase (DIM6/NTAB) family NADH-FMN oxidoreductase RutF